ncbi:MAG: matrixin family metalloprotease, partial [Myxococcota bacterium]
MVRYRFFVCLLGILCLLGSAHPSWAHELWPIDENGRERFWKRDKFPLNLNLDPSGSQQIKFPDVQQALTLTVEEWNKVPNTMPQLLGIAKLKDKELKAEYDGLLVIKFIRQKADWKYGDMEVARTETYYNTRTGEMLDADLLINDWNEQTPIGIGDPQKYDLQSIFSHELGHILGLGHSKIETATMFPSIQVGSKVQRILKDDDKEGIRTLYPKQASCKQSEVSGNQVCENGRYTSLCAPYHQVCTRDSQGQYKSCASHANCLGEKNFCLQYNNSTQCGYDCSTTPCPAGYQCQDVIVNNQKIGRNCVPTGGICASAPDFGCCRSNNDCLPPFNCISGQCVNRNFCYAEGVLCTEKEYSCCNGLSCVDDGAGERCRSDCDPLNPRCEGNLRCAVIADTDFQKGVCVPPRRGKKQGETCGPNEPCEHELGCNSEENKCRNYCRPSLINACPSGYRCLAVKGQTNMGLCIQETGTDVCSKSSECATGRVCKSDRCAPCAKDNECPTQHRCRTGFCRQECTINSTCPRQHRCEDNFCLPGKRCEIDKNCETGEVCRGQVCVLDAAKTCRTKEDCAPGQRCQEQRCRFIDACQNQCKDTESCTNINGKDRCVPKTCSTDPQCGEGLGCRNNTCQPLETTCGGRPKCPEGQVCVNNLCRSQLGGACSGDATCMPGLKCIQLDGAGICSRACIQAEDCTDSFFCTENLPIINKGCWPAEKTDCTSGRCVPKREGCGCHSGTPEAPLVASWLLLALLLTL